MSQQTTVSSSSASQSSPSYTTIPIHTIGSSSSAKSPRDNGTHVSTLTTTINANSSAADKKSTTNGTSRVNPEEFAKLDALLEDLLAEVDQPILLSKDGSAQNSSSYKHSNGNLGRVFSSREHRTITTPSQTPFNSSSYIKSNKLLSSIDDIERSVDWLNEQKERLRTKREMLNGTSSKYAPNSPLAMSEQQLKFADESDENFSSNVDKTNNSYRKIKSKLDYYVSGSNGDQQRSKFYSNGTTPKYGFSYAANPDQSLNKSNGNPFNSDDTTTSSPSVTLNGTIDCSNNSGNENGYGPYLNGNGSSLINNKPPVSPSTRLLYSPVQNAGNNLGGSSFKGYNDVEDEMIAMANNISNNGHHNVDAELDRYGQRSYRTNTIQRTKYHLVSNDYIDCTRPSAPTPLPIQTNKIQPPSQNKRALSAPPTEVGKVLLQRMELKSPITIRPSGSVVPFENHPMYPPQQAHFQPDPSEPVMLQQRNGAQQPLYNSNSLNRHPQGMAMNPYNNRGILKTNNQPQLAPARSVFLNRAYSETPRVAYTNGYETDTGVSYNAGYGNGYRTMGPGVGYSSARSYVADPNLPIENGGLGPGSYHTIGSYSSRPNTGSYLQGPVNRYANNNNIVNEQSGYDTDTGLIKLRQVLDSKRASSRNSNQAPPTPVQNGYYYTNRSMTPSFNYTYASALNPFQQAAPLNGYGVDPRYVNDGSLSSTPYMLDGYPMVQQTLPVPDGFVETNDFIQPDDPSLANFQYNGSFIDQSLPGYITPNGRQVMMHHHQIVPCEMPNDMNASYRSAVQPQPQSFIVHQQVAPSAYIKSASQSAFQNSPNVVSSRDFSASASRPVGAGSSTSNISTQQSQASLDNKEDPKRGSTSSLNGDGEVIRNHPKSVKANQSHWYKPKISREEAINLLKEKPAGTFLIRDSNNFPGAYGLALKVDKPPANVQIKPGADPSNELVRHFLIEPTTKGVRIKGCCNEPIFGSLAALVYQHSITPLALPTKLILPGQEQTDASQTNAIASSQSNQGTLNKSAAKPATPQAQPSQDTVNGRQLLDKGAACNVYYLNTVTLESSNIGLEAITKALNDTKAFVGKDSSQLILIQFKVTGQGITLTDINKKKFLRQHFPTNTVIYCAIDEKLTWPQKLEKISQPRIFGLICKPRAGIASYECHLFVELDPEQPAIAIVDFINRYLIPSKQSSSKEN